MCGTLQIFCSISSAVLLALAIPNALYSLGNPVIGLFALVPLYLLSTTLKSYRRIFGLFFIHGLVLHLLSSFWLGNFEDFAAFTLGASAFGTGFYEGLLGCFIVFPFRYYTTQIKLIEENGNEITFPLIRVLWFAATYTLWEFTKSTGFLAYPWGTVSMSAYTWPLITQIASITGCYGVTFLFSLFSAVTAEGIIICRRTAKSLSTAKSVFSWLTVFRFTCAFFAVTVCYGICEYTKTRLPVKKINTAIIQMNMDPWNKNDYDAIRISQRLTEHEIDSFQRNNKRADLVVWSEGLLHKKFPDSLAHYRMIPYEESLIDFIQRMDTPFIIGGPVILDPELRHYGNCANLFDRYGSYSGYYTKMHLVPFAELIPFIDYPVVQNFVKKYLGFSRGWTPGNKYVLFEIPVQEENVFDRSNYRIYSLCDQGIPKQPSVKIATPICFDDAFGDVCRGLFLTGCELFVNITNDSWSLTESAELQHFVVAHYRSIEYRIPTVRATNSGVSCLIDPTGKIIKALPLFKEKSMGISIPIYKRQMTVYAKYGNWFPFSLFILCAITAWFLRKKEIEYENAGISTECLFYTLDQAEFLEAWPVNYNEWNW